MMVDMHILKLGATHWMPVLMAVGGHLMPLVLLMILDNASTMVVVI